MKTTIKSAQLETIISESVSKALNEIGDTPRGQMAIGAAVGRAAARPRYHGDKYRGPLKDKQDATVNLGLEKAWDGYSNADDDMKRHMGDSYEKGYKYGYQKGIDEPLTDEEKTLKEHIKKLVRESIYDMGGQFEASDENMENDSDVDGREADEGNEGEKERNDRKNVITFFKNKGVDHAPYAYNLYGVEQEEGKDTNEMKNARSKFEKCLNGEPNEAGYPYSFSSAEINRLKSMISSNNLSESVSRAIKNAINEISADLKFSAADKAEELGRTKQSRKFFNSGRKDMIKQYSSPNSKISSATNRSIEYTNQYGNNVIVWCSGDFRCGGEMGNIEPNSVDYLKVSDKALARRLCQWWTKYGEHAQDGYKSYLSDWHSWCAL